MVKSQRIEPKWILIDETLREVSEFAHLSPSERPDAFCPVCQRPVVLKLGNQRVHHYAHQPEDVCIATQPETALHLNTKFYIYTQLLQTRMLYTEETCERHCGAKRQYVWLKEWGDLKVEYTVGSIRLDIALLSEGKVIGAIEVLVSHSVDEQKARYFDDQEISWLEVRATETLYEGDNAWTPDKPLPFYRRHPQPPRWMCDHCKKTEERQREQREYRQNNYEVIHSAKMVDLYFKSGKKYREVYYVMQRVKDGTWVSAWVKTEKNQVIASENAPITKESMKRLNDAVKRRLVRRQREGAIVDEVIPWRRWKKGQKFVARDIDRNPFRYCWDEEQRKWNRC